MTLDNSCAHVLMCRREHVTVDKKLCPYVHGPLLDRNANVVLWKPVVVFSFRKVG